MLSDFGYYDDYKIIINTSFNITEFPSFMDDNQEYLKKLKVTWAFYSIILNISSTIQAHPNYSPDGTGTTQSLYINNSFTPNTINNFNSIDPKSLYSYAYNMIALTEFAKLPLFNNNDDYVIAIKANIITNLKSQSNNNLFNNMNLYIPLFTKNSYNLKNINNTFQKISSIEALFIKFIIQTLNYFITLSSYDDTSLTYSYSGKVTASQIEDIYIRVFGNSPKKLEQLVVDMSLIGDYIIPYIFKFNEILPSLEIPKYFLGVTVYDFLIYKKNNILLQINSYENICNTKSIILNYSN